MGEPVRGHGIRAGHHVIPPHDAAGQQVGEQQMGQAIAVGQLIDPGALGAGRLEQGDEPLVGDGVQKPLLYPAGGGGALGLQLPGEDPVGPGGQLLLQGGGGQHGADVGLDLGGGVQTAVGPLVVLLVAVHARQDLPPDGPQARPVIAVPQVDVLLHRPGILGLHHMGRGAVHQGGPQAGEDHGVQRVRVRGAEDVLHRLTGLGGLLGYLAHQGGLAAPRPALEDVDDAGCLRGEQLRVQGVEAGGGIRPQKILNLVGYSHTWTLQILQICLRLCAAGGGGAAERENPGFGAVQPGKMGV